MRGWSVDLLEGEAMLRWMRERDWPVAECVRFAQHIDEWNRVNGALIIDKWGDWVERPL
jgi:hypothetical protein